jgi:hypothetical protein
MLRMGFRILWLVPEQPLDDHHLSMKIISAVDSEPVQTLHQHLIEFRQIAVLLLACERVDEFVDKRRSCFARGETYEGLRGVTLAALIVHAPISYHVTALRIF